MHAPRDRPEIALVFHQFRPVTPLEHMAVEAYRLLQRISRVLEINMLDKITRDVVEAARDGLVVGTGKIISRYP